MSTYNYQEAICNDIRDYINENDIKVTSENKEDLYQQLNDDLFVSDSVTGNASGSYTFNAWQAEENLCHNLDLLADACKEFGDDINLLSKGAEACDVTIRCYLLGQCLTQVLDELEQDED
jgi:hypothetical protein